MVTEWIMAIGLALNCEVSERSVFHRKNYFYADLPKNYQISQFDIPVCHDGYIDVTVDGTTRRIGIERAHMEEDTGKSTHVGEGGRAVANHFERRQLGAPVHELRRHVRGLGGKNMVFQPVESSHGMITKPAIRIEWLI